MESDPILPDGRRLAGMADLKNKLGLKHGAYHRFGSDIPMSNLFVTVINRLGLPASKFVESTGELTELS